jgi:hypothetical protein
VSLGHSAGVDELAQRCSVHVVAHDAAAEPGHILEIVYHHDVRMGKVISNVEFLLNHAAVLGFVAILRAQSLEHHPLAKLAGSVYMIKFLIPFGQMLYFCPAGGAIGHFFSECYDYK